VPGVRSVGGVKALGVVFVSLLFVVGCPDKRGREPTLIRGSDCEDAYRPAICPGETDCFYDEKTGCQVCTCNSDDHKVDALPLRENMR
jgi:hypothetical protein